MDRPLSKGERVAEFFRRLQAARPVGGRAEAIALLAETLNAVEDEHSGVPYNPSTWQTDGRLYPPVDTLHEVWSDIPGASCFRHVGHKTYFSDGGAILIVQLSNGQVAFSKAGLDGKELRS